MQLTRIDADTVEAERTTTKTDKTIYQRGAAEYNKTKLLAAIAHLQAEIDEMDLIIAELDKEI